MSRFRVLALKLTDIYTVVDVPVDYVHAWQL